MTGEKVSIRKAARPDTPGAGPTPSPAANSGTSAGREAIEDGQPLLSTLDKGLRVLEALAESRTSGESLTGLSRTLGMHRTTVFRMLGTLRARGYVVRDADTDRYHLGVRVLSLASGVLNDLDIRQVARPTLVSLNQESHELVFLSVVDRGEVVTVERLDSDQPLTLRAQIGSRRPLHCTAAGKAYLSAQAPADRAALVRQPLTSFTPRTMTQVEQLMQQLDEMRLRGFAWDDEEFLDGVRCVAAPIFGIERRIVGVVSLAAPTMRAPWDRLWQLGAAVRAAAHQISANLGAPAECFEGTAMQEAS